MMIKDILENEPHEVAEVICLKCLHRWIAVYPQETLLKQLECKCGAIGFVIKTGQSIPEQTQCDNCINNKDGKCKLKLSPDKYNLCGYYTKG